MTRAKHFSFLIAIGIFSTELMLDPSSSRAAGDASIDFDDAAVGICARFEPGSATPFDAADLEAVSLFYSDRDCRPVWISERGLTRAATFAIAEIERAPDWGLSAPEFKLVAARKPFKSGSWTADEVAGAEFEITAAILRFAHQAQGGRITEPDKKLSSYLDRAPTLSSTEEILAQTTTDSDPGEWLRSYQPPQKQFLRLKELLAALRGKSRGPAVPTIRQEGEVLQIGSEDPDVAILKKRFAIKFAAGQERLFDDSLDSAVRSFQKQNGLADDGIVGPLTRAALTGGNRPASVSAQIQATIANMEEWRWMPRSLGSTNVFVNIPAFSVVLTDKDKPVLEERVIVGTEETQTPIFSKDMTTIVIRPPWYLPDSIKLSTLKSGRSVERMGYVVKRNGHVMQSWKIDWSKANLSEYDIYQPSGDDNALGLVKLLFPNKHSVYLHDTPGKWLFDNPVRLYSHGCMRVRNPQALAQAVFDIDRGEGVVDVANLARKGPLNNEFALAAPIPVHVGYFTVWVDDSGEAHFYKDYYGHQQRITLALAGKWDDIDIGKDHLAAVDTSELADGRSGSDDGPRGSRRRSRGNYDPPMGVTKTFESPAQYRPRAASVGDIMRQSMGGW